MNKKILSFPPVLPKNPKVLILGSMPSVKSLEKMQYYGNPRNHFWPILFELFNEEPIAEYEKRVDFVKKHHIALWDSIAACYRKGSLDADIMDEVPNNMIGLLEQYPSISFIGCNGTKSYQTFLKHFDVNQLNGVEVMKLPSSSPIPGRYNKSYSEKVEAWSEILNHI
ncbi:DNA-deoxyinosine glycosylase [Oceanobacillus halophilus]|uniref:DNA-deoxyinosine glycosylase n=1 Tax=Oceanobacillus halophilus TaxID=930130 RepID=A0A495A3S3_9BACI|nr:DNA-deoxyinosine glycosylase [Oceanobacillus halophilus]RKQ33866.1 DNA-deoxyinosine glycosylase [Oceanobacillus halophilus]